jgi:hypothetical protein
MLASRVTAGGRRVSPIATAGGKLRKEKDPGERRSYTIPNLTHSVSRVIPTLFYKDLSNIFSCSPNVMRCFVTPLNWPYGVEFGETFAVALETVCSLSGCAFNMEMHQSRRGKTGNLSGTMAARKIILLWRQN